MKFQHAALLIAATTLAAQSQGPGHTLIRECNQAWALTGERRWTEAIHAFQEILARDRNFAPAYRPLIGAFEDSGRWDLAEQYFLDLLQLDPQNGLIHFALAETYTGRKNSIKARAQYLEWIRSLPQCRECSFHVLSAEAQQSVADAAGELESLLARNPGSPVLYSALAEAYRTLLRRPDALRVYQSGLAVAEAAGDDRGLAEYLLYGYRLVTTSGQDWEEGLPFIRRTLSLFEREEDENLVHESLRVIVNNYRWLGDPGSARTYAQILIERSQGHPDQEASALEVRGAVSAAFGGLEAAIDDFSRAAQTYERIGDRYSFIRASQKLGDALLFAGDSQRAISTYKHSFELAEASGFDFLAAYALRSLGNAYGDIGDHWRELDSHIRSTEKFQRLNPHTAGAGFGSIGSAYFSLGDYEKAETYYKQALESAIKFDDAGEQERHLSNLGELYLAKHDFVRAITHLDSALSFADRVGLLRFKAGTLITLSEVYRKQRKYKEAAENCRAGLAIARSLGVKILEAAALNTLAGILLNAGVDIVEARQAYAEALALSDASGFKEGVWTAHKGLGEILIREHRFAESLDHLESAIQILESMRAQIPSPVYRVTFLEDKLDLYESTLETLSRLHQAHRHAGYERKAFQYAEQSRARAFLESLTESRAGIRQGLTAEQAEHHTALLRDYSRASSSFLQQSSTRARAALAKAEEKLELFLAVARRTSPKYAELVYPKPYTADQAQADAKRQGIVLVAYFLGKTRSLAWIVTPTRTTMVSLPSRSVIEDQVLRYRKVITRRPSSERELTSHYELGNKLYRTLILPMAGLLEAQGRLVIIPDGILHYLPFETLICSAYPQKPKFLVEDFSITYAPSAAVFEYLSRMKHDEPPRSMQLLAYADPDFGTPKSNTSASTRLRGLYASGGIQFPRLPRTRDEVLSISGLFGLSRQKLHFGQDATEGSLKREDLRAYRKIHFATHAVIDERIPSRSGVVLSLVGRDGEDGILHVPEILNLEMNADLVVLSACRTGLGRIVRGEGMIGLTRAFFYAGTQRVVVSLWGVNDISTSEFMKAFYRHMGRGVAPASALRATRSEMLNSPVLAYRHPYFWAPFVLVGKM